MKKISSEPTEDLLYIFGEGKYYHAYHIFGSHIEKGGVRFTVWAPFVKSVSVIGDWNDIEMELKIGSDHQGNSLIAFCPVEPIYSDGEKVGSDAVDGLLGFGNRKYICEGENAYDEIMAIISE